MTSEKSLASSGTGNWQELFEKARRRPKDEQVWSALYRELWPYLSDWIMSRYGIDPDRAGEILQSAFIAYGAQLAEGQVERTSIQHLRAFIRYRVLDFLRQQSRLVSLDEIAEPLGSLRSATGPAAQAHDR